MQPDNMLAHIHRGLAKAKMGHFEQAITDFNQALELQTDNESAYINRGLSKYYLGQFQPAIADFDQALSLQPDSALAYYNRGLAKSDFGQLEDAITDFSQALRHLPTWQSLRNMRIHKSRHRPSKAGGPIRIIPALRSDSNRAGYTPVSSKFSLVDSPIRLQYNAALPAAYIPRRLAAPERERKYQTHPERQTIRRAAYGGR